MFVCRGTHGCWNDGPHFGNGSDEDDRETCKYYQPPRMLHSAWALVCYRWVCASWKSAWLLALPKTILWLWLWTCHRKWTASVSDTEGSSLLCIPSCSWHGVPRITMCKILFYLMEYSAKKRTKLLVECWTISGHYQSDITLMTVKLVLSKKWVNKAKQNQGVVVL